MAKLSAEVWNQSQAVTLKPGPKPLQWMRPSQPSGAARVHASQRERSEGRGQSREAGGPVPRVGAYHPPSPRTPHSR